MWSRVFKVLFCALFGISATRGICAELQIPTDSMVFVWAEDREKRGRENWKPLGSGFLVGREGDILTAKHVVHGKVTGEEIFVSIRSKSNYPIKIDEENISCVADAQDICIINIPQDSLPTDVEVNYALGCYLPKGGEQLRALGFYGGSELQAGVIQQPGVVSGNTAPRGLVPTNLALVPTMSGGPVFDSTDRVVGIVKGGAAGTSGNLTFITPVARAASLLLDRNIDCPREPDASSIIPIRFFPKPRLLDIRTLVSWKEAPEAEWIDAPAVVSIESLSYENTKDPGPNARIAGEALVLKVDEREVTYSEFQRVNIGTDGKGWLGRVGDPIAITIPAGHVVAHTSQFKPIGYFAWSELLQAVRSGKAVSASVSAWVSWQSASGPKRTKISTDCIPTVSEMAQAQSQLIEFEEQRSRSAARLTIYCRGG